MGETRHTSSVSCGVKQVNTAASGRPTVDPIRSILTSTARTFVVAALIVMADRLSPAIAQTPNSNAGLEGGQDNLFDAILATPNQKTPVLQDNVFATAPGLGQVAPAPQFTLNALAPALFNSNTQFLSSGGSKAFEGSPLVRLGWASQLFDTPIRVSGAASFETERFVNAPGAAIDYIRPSVRAQYINPENDQDYSPFLSYVPRVDFDPTFANNFATRQDVNFGIDKVFNFDCAFNRVPPASNSSSATVWSFGFSIGAQRRFRDPRPQSHAFIFNPSASYVISDQWNASFSMPITRRWFDTTNGVSQRNLTWEPTGVVEYVIPGDWLGGADAARWRGNPAMTSSLGWRETGRTYPGANTANGASVSSSRRGGGSKSGRQIMDRKGRTVFRGLLLFLFIAACVSVATGSRARAVEPGTRAPATELADGFDRARARDPWHPPLRRLARSPDQCARPTVRRGLTCANDRAHGESGADAGRELLGNYAGSLGRVTIRARFQNHWQVFGGLSQPYLRK